MTLRYDAPTQRIVDASGNWLGTLVNDSGAGERNLFLLTPSSTLANFPLVCQPISAGGVITCQVDGEAGEGVFAADMLSEIYIFYDPSYLAGAAGTKEAVVLIAQFV